MVEVEIENPEEVCAEPRYWNPIFCRSFLDSWNVRAHENTTLGRRWADAGIRLVAKVEELHGPSPGLHARALVMLGSSFRRIGDLDSASAAFVKANDLYRDLEDPIDRADLYLRWALVFRDQGDRHKALEYIDIAAMVFLAAGERHHFGRALIVRGTTYGEAGNRNAALWAFSKALRHLDYARSPSAYYTARYNLTVETLEPSSSREVLEKTLEDLREARYAGTTRYRKTDRRPIGIRRCTVPDTCLRHLQALVLSQLGRGAQARQLLEEARDDFTELEMPLDVVAVLLDLALLHNNAGRWKELHSCATKALKLLRQVPGSDRATAAFKLLVEAETAIDDEIIEIVERCRGVLNGHPNRVPSTSTPAPDPTTLRQRLRRIVRRALASSKDLTGFDAHLREAGVVLHHQAPQGGRPGGVSYELDGVRVAGARLRLSLSVLEESWSACS
jgi:tetratricopeptide (TPR) repeat protein